MGTAISATVHRAGTPPGVHETRLDESKLFQLTTVVAVTTYAGLVQFVRGPSLRESSIRILDRSHGLSSADLLAVAEDLAGNLWLGTFDAGAMRIGRGAFVTYGPEDGLTVPRNRQILDGLNGEIVVIGGARYAVYRFDGRRFAQTLPALPASIEDMGWGRRQISFRDSYGEWWFGTFGGLVRIPAVTTVEELASVQPSAHYTTRNGLLSNGVFRVYEDRNGDLWISVMHYTVQEQNGLQRWDRATEEFHTYREADGVPQDAPTAFREDGAGNLWVGYYARGLGRFRGGTYRHFTREDGAPTGHVTTMYLDHLGRMWIGVDGGVFRIDDPNVDHPVFRWHGAAEGLSGDTVFCITEDEWGRIYLGSGSGLDRLEPETGHVRHYSRADGLASNRVLLAHRDPRGSLWFGTTLGLSRLEPRDDSPNEAPPVRIVGIRIAGEPCPVSPFGENDLAGIRLAPSERQLKIEFSGLSFVLGEELRFQYRLEGADKSWSKPTTDRRVQFASLSPGRYRFVVRAIDSENLISPEPAVVSFRVLPPFWQRWWFVSLMAVVVAAVGYAFHRVRLRRVVELERVRTRIATDLHDDIGSSLSQVSILSEVVRQKVEGERPRDAVPLVEQIAGTSRELVDSMSDIVWAINPKRDRAADLVQRMRRFASDTFSGKGISFRFEAPEGGQDRRLGVEVRRQVYLIFKEAVNNAARHSGCSTATVEFMVSGRGLRLTVSDDGRGFDTTSVSEGHGLGSMQARAEGIGATLTVESAAENGTTVRLSLPL
jgi:two-component sensor histidine kinase